MHIRVSVCVCESVFFSFTKPGGRPPNRHNKGGVEIIMDVAGKDATTDFEGIGHSDVAKEFLTKYKVGTLKK